MDHKESDFQTIYKKHIHEKLLLREQEKNLDTNKATKLKELNIAEANFKARYKKYMKIAKRPKPEVTSLPNSPRQPASPRPPYIICKDVPYSFKTWGNLTDVSPDREDLDVYKSEVLQSEEKELELDSNEYQYIARKRSSTAPASYLAHKIANFRQKGQCLSPTDSEDSEMRCRASSFSNVIRRRKMTPNTVGKSRSNENVTSEVTSLIPQPPNGMSYAALLRCPEKISRSTIPSIVLTTDNGLKLSLDEDRRKSSSISEQDQKRLDLYIRRRKSCIGLPSADRPKSNTEALKDQMGLSRLLATSRYLSVSSEYIDKIATDADGKDYVADSFKELKKCRYLRSKSEDVQLSKLPGIQTLVLPPVSSQTSKKLKHV